MGVFTVRFFRDAVTVSAIVFLASACKHGVLIKGQGNVESASGTRDCASLQSECRFDVQGAYKETFTALPASGWLFDAWEGCSVTMGNQCSFDISADVVEDFKDFSIPSALARFRRPIRPLFRDGAGNYGLPDTPAAGQLDWLLNQIAASSTSLSEINQRFDSNYLSSVSASEIQQSIDSLRNYLSNAVVVDLISVTPVLMRAVIGDPTDPEKKGAYIALETRYEGDGVITSLQSTYPYFTNGSITGAAEKSKNLAQLASTFAQLATNTSILIAEIENDKCEPITKRSALAPQPTGSIFKIWTLGALTREVAEGRIDVNTMIPLSADDSVPAGSGINATPLGTQFSLTDMAALMMGISDNSATDHIQELVGRDKIERTLQLFKHKNKQLMTPFLKVNEQFNIYWTLSPQQASDYTNGSEDFQRAFLENTLEPLEPATQFPYANEQELLESSWAASAFDVCSAYVGLRKFNNRTPAFNLMDQAIGAEAGGLLGVRNRWDRVWSKGGSLANANGNYVYTYSVLFESDEKGAYVVVLMANNPDGSAIDAVPVFSIVSRAEEILFNR